SSTAITATLPAHPAGCAPVTVTVQNPDGQKASAPFSYACATLSFSRTPITVGMPPARMAIADFNGDGKLDALVAIEATTGAVNVLLGRGDGTFQAPLTAPTAGSGTLAALAGDFNGDGKPDAVVSNLFGGTLSVLLGKGDGTFQDAMSIDLPLAPAGIAAGD